MALATAVDQVRTALLESVHGECGPCAVAQQPLQPCSVWCLNAHPGIDREAATVLAGSGTLVYVFGVMRLQMNSGADNTNLLVAFELQVLDNRQNRKIAKSKKQELFHASEPGLAQQLLRRIRQA